jgi:hypothetical protein
MKAPLFLVLSLFAVHTSFTQAPPTDYLDGLELARTKHYSTARVSSSNQLVASNDDSKRIMPGETLVMADLNGPGMVTHIWLTAAQNEYGWPRLLRLRVYYDGHKTPSVDVPPGDFFAVGHGSEHNVNSMMIHNSSFGRARNSYWPMPFFKTCRITLTNEGDRMLPMFYYHVDYRKYTSLPPDTEYFHAYYRQERPARMGKNYEFLNVHGSGHYVGTVLSVVQTQLSWFGEGDDLFYIDGAEHPQIVGTGSEDYFNDAWDLREADSAWTGTPITEGSRLGSRLTGYRWHVPDPIVFTKSLWAGIEHSGWTVNPDGSFRSGFEERPDYFSSVAFWYQKGVNEELPEPPYGRDRLPFGNATQLTIQNSINDVTAEGGKAIVQKEVDWAKDLLVLLADGPKATINIPIDIPEKGKYEILALIAQAPDYGNYTAWLDGKPTNLDTRQAATSEIPFPGPEVFHNYLPEVYVARDRAIGMFDLTQGRHILTFVCAGKDDGSVGYNIGINDIVLEKVPETDQVGTDSDRAEPNKNAPAAAPNSSLYRGRPLVFYVGNLAGATGSHLADLLYAISAFGADGGSAADKVAAFVTNGSEEVRAAAVTALGNIGASAPSGIPSLARSLSDPSSRIRSLAIIGLRSQGPKGLYAEQDLVLALNDPTVPVRALAADALGAIGPAAHESVLPLVRRALVPDESRFVINNIMAALGRMGPSAHDALPILKEAVQQHKLGSNAECAILLIEGKHVPTYF